VEETTFIDISVKGAASATGSKVVRGRVGTAATLFFGQTIQTQQFTPDVCKFKVHSLRREIPATPGTGDRLNLVYTVRPFLFTVF